MISLQSEQTYRRTIHYRPQIDDFQQIITTEKHKNHERLCIVPDFLDMQFHIDDKYISIDEEGFYRVSDSNKSTIGIFTCLNNAAYAYMLYTESKISDPVHYLEHLYGMKQNDIAFV